MKQTFIITTFVSVFITQAWADDKPVHPEMWMFDTKPITATSPAPSKAPTFKVGTDRIYARVFYDRPLNQVFTLNDDKNSLHLYHALLAGEIVYDHVDMWLPKADFEKKWLDIEIYPDPKTAKILWGEHNRSMIGLFAWALERKVTGKHPYYVSISAKKDADVRAAVINLDVSGLNEDKLKADIAAAKEAGAKAFASNLGLPKPGSLHSPSLAKQTEAMTKKVNRDLVAVKVVFTADSWETERNDLTGRILGRTADAALVMKEKTGTCFLDVGIVRQQYIGGKFRAPGEWANTATTPQQIDCKKAFK